MDERFNEMENFGADRRPAIERRGETSGLRAENGNVVYDIRRSCLSLKKCSCLVDSFGIYVGCMVSARLHQRSSRRSAPFFLFSPFQSTMDLLASTLVSSRTGETVPSGPSDIRTATRSRVRQVFPRLGI